MWRRLSPLPLLSGPGGEEEGRKEGTEADGRMRRVQGDLGQRKVVILHIRVNAHPKLALNSKRTWTFIRDNTIMSSVYYMQLLPRNKVIVL